MVELGHPNFPWRKHCQLRTIPDRAGDLVMGDTEKVEDLISFFSSVFTVKVCLQPRRAVCLGAEFEGNKYC